MDMASLVLAWVGWGLIGLCMVIFSLGFWKPMMMVKVFLIIKIIVLFVVNEIRSIFNSFLERCSNPVADINVRDVPIDGELVNPVKNGVQYQDCPANIIVRYKVNHTIEIDVGTFQEKCSWYSFPGVNFYVGKGTGRIKRVVVNNQYIRNRGVWFRNTCVTTDWPKYFTSVVLAHVEVLKFSQRCRSHHPGVISRIFKYYGENIFGEI